MSFILDALKKSDTERQQHGNAELAGGPSNSGPKSGRTWIWIVGPLLAVNLAVLTGLLLRSSDAPETVVTDAQIPGPIVRDIEYNDTRAPSFADQVATARQNAPPKQANTSTGSSSATPVVQPVVEATIVSQNSEAIRSTDAYPTIHAVRASGAISIPDLHLDIHVYSDVPKDRFVFINMSKHREGSQLEEGPVVDKITEDGVVLGHRGISFLLPRN